MTKILITGACGQFGSELTTSLRSKYGNENVIATDIKDNGKVSGEGHFELFDVLNRSGLEEIVSTYQITEIYHLAALLSATAEKEIETAWKLNVDGLLNILNIAKEKSISKVFWPSSIAVFGPDADKKNASQNSACNPTTVYGISKLAGEQWCAYFHRRFDVDVRSLRFPGLIGYKSMPGGGTTDYAVDIYHKAAKDETFICFLGKDSRLPMMYMTDAVKATIDLMNASGKNLNVRTSYNITAMSFTPEEITTSIRQYMPEFKISYEPDYRQKIADSWPDSIDDSVAKKDWGWRPEFDLNKMTKDILENLPAYLSENEKIK
jgi:nucleoside-diphosphate-sugar epimerase